MRRNGGPAGLIRPERYPRASRYDPAWVLSLDMGPHPLWQLEDLLDDLRLRPGQRVLDLGSGKGATAVFLARECGVDVVAADLWTPAADAAAVFAAADVTVTAVNADARALPFEPGEFDALVSVDAFEYFGTDVHLLPRLLDTIRPGGRIAMSTPALRHDPYAHPVPEHVAAVVGWEAAAWHAPTWWETHWGLSGLVTDIRARWQDGGADDWLRWARAVSEDPATDPVVRMLEIDGGDHLGFALVSATRT